MSTYEVEGMSDFERQFVDCSVAIEQFPFESRLSLEPLFSFWEEAARGERPCTHPVLANEIEEYELEDLQGVHGLRAFRVTVNVEAGASEEINPAEVETAVNEFSIA